MKNFLAIALLFNFCWCAMSQTNVNQQSVIQSDKSNYITVMKNGVAKRVSEVEFRDSLKLDIEDKFYPSVVTNIRATNNAPTLRGYYVRGTQDSIYKIDSKGKSLFIGFNGRQTKTAMSYTALNIGAAIGESLLLPTGEMITKVSTKKWFSNKVLGSTTPVQYSIINTDTVSNEKAIWENPNISVIAGQTVAFIYYNAAWKPQKGFLDVEDFGAKGDGTTNDYAAIVACITYFENLGAGVIEFYNKIYKCNTGLVINPAKIRLEGNNTTLDFTTAPTNVTAIAWLGAGSGNPWLQADKGMSGLIIKGSSASNPSTGIKFSAPSTLAAAHFTLKNCTTVGFGVGELFESNSYLISNYNCEIWGCTRGVYIPSGLTNSGEGIRFYGGAIYGNDYNMDIRWEGTTISLFGTSLDYPNIMNIYMTKGRLVLDAVHIETNSTQQILVPTGNTFPAIISMNGGIIYNSSSKGTTPRVDFQGLVNFTWIGGSCFNQYGGGTIIRGNSNAKIIIKGTQCETQTNSAFFTPNGSTYEVNSKQYNDGVPIIYNNDIVDVENIVPSTPTSETKIEIGKGKTGNGASYLDLIGDPTYSDYGLRLYRNSGANGGSNITHRGNGDFNLLLFDAANFRLKTNAVERLSIDSTGNTTINGKLEVISTISGVIFPRMTTTQRDAISPKIDGSVIYNTTTSKLQVRAAGAWVDLH